MVRCKHGNGAAEMTPYSGKDALSYHVLDTLLRCWTATVCVGANAGATSGSASARIYRNDVCERYNNTVRRGHAIRRSCSVSLKQAAKYLSPMLQLCLEQDGDGVCEKASGDRLTSTELARRSRRSHVDLPPGTTVKLCRGQGVLPKSGKLSRVAATVSTPETLSHVVVHVTNRHPVVFLGNPPGNGKEADGTDAQTVRKGQSYCMKVGQAMVFMPNGPVLTLCLHQSASRDRASPSTPPQRTRHNDVPDSGATIPLSPESEANALASIRSGSVVSSRRRVLPPAVATSDRHAFSPARQSPASKPTRASRGAATQGGTSESKLACSPISRKRGRTRRRESDEAPLAERNRVKKRARVRAKKTHPVVFIVPLGTSISRTKIKVWSAGLESKCGTQPWAAGCGGSALTRLHLLLQALRYFLRHPNQRHATNSRWLPTLS